MELLVTLVTLAVVIKLWVTEGDVLRTEVVTTEETSHVGSCCH